MKNKTFLFLISIGAMQVSVNALASSSFNGSSTIAFSIDSILNTTNPGDNSGLNITGVFEIADADSAPGFGKTVSGDGNSAFTHAGGESLEQSFSANGAVNNGTVDSYYQSFGNLKFNNNSTDSYTIMFSMDYVLKAGVTGDFATNTVSLDYFNDAGDISGYAEASASSSLNLADQTTAEKNTFTLNLDGMQSDIFYADIAINGYAEASAVPLPAAGWLMFSSLVLLKRFSTRSRFVQEKTCK